jgi:hypothetical protein
MGKCFGSDHVGKQSSPRNPLPGASGKTNPSKVEAKYKNAESSPFAYLRQTKDRNFPTRIFRKNAISYERVGASAGSRNRFDTSTQ